MSRILLIDDDASVRSFIRRALARAGHEIIEANDGQAAAKELSAGPVDLVITDLIMPGTEGVELILGLRRDRSDLPIIAISGGGRMASESYLKIARTCGADRVLAKPFTIEELLSAVTVVLKK